MQYLAREANYPHSYMGIHNRQEGRLPLAYGNGILSSHPLENPDTHAFGGRLLSARAFFVADALSVFR